MLDIQLPSSVDSQLSPNSDTSDTSDTQLKETAQDFDSKVYPSKCPEGNGPGALFGIDSNGQAFGFTHQ